MYNINSIITIHEFDECQPTSHPFRITMFSNGFTDSLNGMEDDEEENFARNRRDSTSYIPKWSPGRHNKAIAGPNTV